MPTMEANVASSPRSPAIGLVEAELRLMLRLISRSGIRSETSATKELWAVMSSGWEGHELPASRDCRVERSGDGGGSSKGRRFSGKQCD